MKISANRLYLGNIKNCNYIESNEQDMGFGCSFGGINYTGELEPNGEKELLIKFGPCFVALKEINGSIKYLRLSLYVTENSIKYPSPNSKYYRYFIQSGRANYVGDRYVEKAIQIFPNSDEKISLSDLNNLRIALKYNKAKDYSRALEGMNYNDNLLSTTEDERV